MQTSMMRVMPRGLTTSLETQVLLSPWVEMLPFSSESWRETCLQVLKLKHFGAHCEASKFPDPLANFSCSFVGGDRGTSDFRHAIVVPELSKSVISHVNSQCTL